ncbi:MAG: GlsB/YeaQ/YmgE family stress response membrane protein [Propionibacteriaceae bacterium]|jgi:uncharacterized membrane protein YeaQ/YmgE (transglycosylase-associated protein family)|nr:GlsB/YeaQ/YmgE family stress response membrane protein [Propionibacteriaceae bacterium]
MSFIAWIIMGLIAGAIAHAILKVEGTWLANLICGVAGGVVGGFIGSIFFGHGVNGLFSPFSWLLCIGGSVLVLWAYGRFAKR